MDEGQAEEVLLDEDAEAAGHSFWDLGDLQVGLPADQAAPGQLIVPYLQHLFGIISPLMALLSWRTCSLQCAYGSAVAHRHT